MGRPRARFGCFNVSGKANNRRSLGLSPKKFAPPKRIASPLLPIPQKPALRMNQTAVPFLLRVMGAALLYFILPSVALGCSQAQSSNPNPVPPPTPLDQIGEHLGFFAKMPGKDHFEFHRWESEETINEVLWHMKYKSGGEIHFAPGTYEIRQWIFVNEIPDLRITGSPGVQLVFAEGPDVLSRNKNAINKDDLSIAVEDPELFRVDGRYQMYMADGRGDRILEFEVTKIEEDRVFRLSPSEASIPSRAPGSIG